MTPARLSYVCTGSFLATVFLLQWWESASYPLELWIVLILSMGFLVSWLLVAGFKRKIKKQSTSIIQQPANPPKVPVGQPATLLTLATILGTVLAFVTVSHNTHIPSSSTLDSYAHGKEVTVTGIIDDIPDKRALVTQYTVRVERLQQSLHEDTMISIADKTLVVDRSGWPEFDYGDTVTVRGTLEIPKATDTFAYDRYLAISGIHTVLRAKHIDKIVSGGGNSILRFLYWMRTSTENQINRLYPEPHASFLAGLLLGSRRSIDRKSTRLNSSH